MLAWFGNLAPFISNSHILKEIRWYVRRFNPALPVGQPSSTLDPATGKPYARFENTGPPARVHPVNVSGSSVATPLPYQAATSITFRTPVPKHWGRIYLPGMHSADLNASAPGAGRLANNVVTPIADSTASLVQELANKHFQLVVPTTQVDSKFHVALQMVNQVVVDDIPDVIRRRRAKQATLHHVGVPT